MPDPNTERVLAEFLNRETVMPASVSANLASRIVTAVNNGIVPPIVPKKPRRRETTND